MATRPEDVTIGTESGTVEIDLTDAIVDEFLAAMEVDEPLFTKGAVESGKRLAPPHLAPKLSLYPLYGKYIDGELGGAVFAKQTFTFHAPAWVGTKVRGRAKIVDKYERRGKNFVVFEGEFTDEAGKPLVTERRTVMPIASGFKMS